MKRGISVAKLFEKSKQEEKLNNTLIPDWLIKYGGAVIAVGGLGYLWYLNSSLRAYHQIKDEEVCRLHHNLLNKLFIEYYLMDKTLTKQIFIMRAQQEEIENRAFDFGDPRTQNLMDQNAQQFQKEHITPVIENELKNSKHKKLSVKHYTKKVDSVRDSFEKKVRNGVEVTDREIRLNDFINLTLDLSISHSLKAFQFFNAGSQADGLDHKECFQLLLDYQAETIHVFATLFQRMVIEDGFDNFEKRDKAFSRLFEQRHRMEPLHSYAVEKLGAHHTELPEDEKYDPLILFLAKAINPPPDAKYTSNEICKFFELLIFACQYYMVMYVVKLPQDPMKIVKKKFKMNLDHSDFKKFLEDTGIHFDPFKD